MSYGIHKLLMETPSDTAVKELSLNGKKVEGVEKFVGYDRVSGLAFFKNKSNSTFTVMSEKIDRVVFVSEGIRE